MPNEAPSTVITYGENFSVDLEKLPQKSVIALARRGLSHLLGSEQASKVTAYFDPEHDEAEARKSEDKNAKKLDFQKAAFQALLDGTIGASVRGPSVDPISAIINRLAKAEVKAILANFKLKWPAKAEDTVKLPDGSQVTGAQLIARRLDATGPAGVDKKTGVAHAERLRKEAEKIAAEQAKKNAKNEAMADGAVL